MKIRLLTVMLASLCFAVSAGAAERHMMPSVVPADKLAEARALKNPLAHSPEVIEQGKVVYNSKGGCVTCHGIDGDGKGPAAAGMNPSPRNFLHHGFWRHRTEGEVFWAIKYGSPGTAMIAFGSVLSDNEIWALIHYEQTFAGMHGMMGHREGMGPGMGGREGMGHRGQKGKGGMSECEGDSCAR
ncbi:c-type cytochrome [Nitrospira sp. BLG_1]|uniref:c-type cytochrome n=1 Tax=Nitrospira sp. BLG_1 TaxID=3395883 RepID=UPI0039BCE4F7